MKAHQVLSDLAERQHGVAGRRQLRSAGVTRHAEQALVAAGHAAPVGGRVLRVAGAPITPHQELMSAVLDAGPGSAASHEAAAWLWRLPGFHVGPLDVSRGRGLKRGEPMLGELHETGWLPASHVTIADGVPVTNPARTLFDLAGTLRIERLALAVDAALSRTPSLLHHLHAMLPTLGRRGRPGITAMREVLEDRPVACYTPPASGLEARVIRVLDEAGIATERQVDLGGEHWIGRADLRVMGEPVLIEVDSVLHHFSRSDRERDCRRDADMLAAGLLVVRVHEEEALHRPWVVPSKVRSAVAEARRLFR